jgi:hypothetical protein
MGVGKGKSLFIFHILSNYCINPRNVWGHAVSISKIQEANVNLFKPDLQRGNQNLMRRQKRRVPEKTGERIKKPRVAR